jgi:hypothetical protein
MYDEILVELNLPTLQARTKFLDALFLSIVFKNNFSASSVFDTVALRVPAKSVRDFSTFDVRHRTKVSPSAGCVLRQMLSADALIFVTESSFF